jgi:hypothetical protein
VAGSCSTQAPVSQKNRNTGEGTSGEGSARRPKLNRPNITLLLSIYQLNTYALASGGICSTCQGVKLTPVTRSPRFETRCGNWPSQDLLECIYGGDSRCYRVQRSPGIETEVASTCVCSDENRCPIIVCHSNFSIDSTMQYKYDVTLQIGLEEGLCTAQLGCGLML